MDNGVQFFQSGIYHKDNYIDDYWIMNVFNINMKAIDYKRSIIFKTEKTFNKIGQLDIKNITEFLKNKKIIEEKGYPHGILIQEFKLKTNINSDFITLLNVEGGVKYLVSEKLRNKIENSNCTGIEFMPAEMRLTDWLHGEREKIYGKA